ncbi:MAG: ATP-dependent helicase [Candidatus Dormibacterales bacterium]
MTRLSREQVAAANRLQGPVRIVAGPGTGKTAVIAERFRRLVAAGADPASILVMTFTERAAAGMRARIEAALGEVAGDLQVGTFHSVALGWLREDGARVGLPRGFRILAGAERWILMRELLWETASEALCGEERPDELVSPLLRMLDRMKQELVPVSHLRAWAKSCPEPEAGPRYLAAADLFDAYRGRCRRERLVDFEDLLRGVVELLSGHPDRLARYRTRFPHVMVDEYQDTSLAQERMVELLAGPAASVCVVGDDDQSIYRFRGASRANLERFAASFPGVTTSGLGENRRSTRPLVAAAGRLIAHNPDRLAKLLRAGRKGPPVEVWACADGSAEAARIAGEVGRLARGGTRLGEIAVLTRTNAMFGAVLDTLTAAGIPYQTWGARGLLERPEVKDVIAYLRLVHDPQDQLALARLVGRRGAGLDPDRALAAVRRGREEGVEPLQAIAALDGTGAWVGLVSELGRLARDLGVGDLLFELLSRTRHAEVAPAVSGAERLRVEANVARFAELVDEFCERARDQSLGAFLAHLDLVLLSGEGEEQARVEELADAVQVMTIHQAKGLEFTAVFVPGVVEGRLPQSGRPDGFQVPAQVVEAAPRREDVVAEERRLCYVAMTRARRRLYLSWASAYGGSRRWRPSRFLDELAGEAGEVRVRRFEAPAPVPAAAQDADGAGPGREPLLLSFTAIGVYRECPRRYWYRYRHRVGVPEPDDARFGTLVHECLRRLGEARAGGRAITEETVASVHREVWSGARLGDPRRLPALSRLALSQLRRYREGGGFADAPALVEHRFSAPLPGWTLTGVVDRADRLGGGGGGGWRLVDYKTGAPLPAARLRRDLQLALYALGARSSLAGEGEPIELEIVYLRTGTAVRVEAGEELLAAAREAGAEVARGVAEGRFEARPERRRCRLCPYRPACEEAL